MDLGVKSYVSRRSLLAITALGGSALLTRKSPGALMRTGDATSDPGSPDQLLHTFLKMRGALDDRLVIGYLQGRYYGVVEEEVLELYGFISATFSRYRPFPTGGYEIVSSEVAFFTDLQLEKPLDAWRNPYTNGMVAVQQPHMPAARLIIDRDLGLRFPEPRPGITLQHRVFPISAVADDFGLIEELRSSQQATDGAKPFHYSETLILRSKRSDLAAPDSKRVPCFTSYESVVSWRPWLQMGSRPGHLLGVGAGGYGIELTSMPSTFLDALGREHPRLLKDPGSAIAELWRSVR